MTKLFGLAFLDPTTVDDYFAEEMYEDIPSSQRCAKFADYVVETYISPESLSISHVSGYIYRQQNPGVHLTTRYHVMHTIMRSYSFYTSVYVCVS